MSNERPAIAPTAETYVLLENMLRPMLVDDRPTAKAALMAYFSEYGPNAIEQMQLHGAEQALLGMVFDRLALLLDREPVELMGEAIKTLVEKLNR